MSSSTNGSPNTSRKQWHGSPRRPTGPVGIAGALFLSLSLMGCAAGTAVLPPGLPAVAGGFFTILTLEVVDGIVGRTYLNRLRTRGATAPLSSCAITSGSLPPGVNIRTGSVATPSDTSDDDTCVLVGAPTSAGTFLFTVEMRDSSFAIQRATQGYSMRIRPEFEIATFSVVDAIAGRDYSNSFSVATDVSNNPDPDEIDSGEAGNGPITACTINGLPAGVGFTCVVSGGTSVDISLTNTAALAASGPTDFTISLQDNAILQDGNTVVPATAVTNLTNNTPFALSFTVRPEFSITNALPATLPDGSQNGAYNEDITVTTNLSNSGTEVAQSGEFGNGPITACEAINLPASLSSSFVLTGGGTGCTITVSGTITAGQGSFNLSVEVTDSNITQTGVVVDLNTLTFGSTLALTVVGPLEFTLATVDAGATTACAGGTFNPHASADAPDAVIGRTYGTPLCDLLFTATGGVAPMTWNFSAPGMPELNCVEEGTGNRLLRCNTEGNAVSGGATTDDLTVDVTDNNGTNQDTEFGTGHTAHTIVVHDALAFAPADGTSDAPPPGVVGRQYGNTAASNCGTGGTDACSALVYVATGGLTPYSIFKAPAAEAAPSGDGTPTPVVCTDDAVDTFTCTGGAAVVTAAADTYLFTLEVTDAAGNDTTPGSVQVGLTRDIDIFAAMAVALESPAADPPAAVDGRNYGNSLDTCAGAVPCAPLLYRAAGGLGDPAVTDSYLFSFTNDPDPGGTGFPDGIACADGDNPDDDELTCAALAGIAVNTTGTYTPEVDVDDVGNATTAAGNATAPENLVVNDELEFRLVTLPNNAAGPFTDTDPPLPGVEGREYANIVAADCGATGTDPCEALGFLPTSGSGLGSYDWDLPVAGLPGDLGCIEFAVSPSGETAMACFSDAPTAAAPAPQSPAGVFPFTVTLRDIANASAPAGFTSIDNLGHSSHTSVINAALSVDSISPLDSVADGDTPATILAGSGGLTPQVWTAPLGDASPTLNTGDADCDGLDLTTAGAFTGTATAGAGNNFCLFDAQLDDAGNALTPSSAATGTFDSASLNLPISPAGSPTIDNDVLINGLAGFDYTQLFTASNVNGTAAWVEAGSAGTDCPTPGGTVPTGTALGAATGLLSGPATTAEIVTFGVCVEDDGAGTFSLKNFTVTINQALVGVTNSGSDDVSGIDTATDTTGGTAPVGDDPRAADFSRDGTRAVIANFGDLSLTVLDTLTGDAVNTFSIGTDSFGVAITPDGAFAYVTGFSDNVVRKIDLSDGSVAATISVGAAPRGIALNFNTIANASVAAINGGPGTRAFVANSGDDNVSVINLTTDTEIDTVPGGGITRISVGDEPHGVSFDPASNRVFVTNFGANSYSMYDILSGTVTTRVLTTATADATGPGGLVVTPDGQHLYVATEGGTVEVYDIRNNSDNTATAPNTFLDSVDFTGGGSVLRGIDTTVDRLKTYAADSANDEAVVIDTDPSGSFNTVHANSPVAVGTTPTAEHGVRTLPYPVLHFTLAETGGVRILAQADGDGVAYSDFVRVLGGVAPYTFAETTTNLGTGGNNCEDLGLDANTGEVSDNSVDPPGGAGTKNCDFTIEVTDSATVPQVITGNFRIVIVEE